MSDRPVGAFPEPALRRSGISSGGAANISRCRSTPSWLARAASRDGSRDPTGDRSDIAGPAGASRATGRRRCVRRSRRRMLPFCYRRRPTAMPDPAIAAAMRASSGDEVPISRRDANQASGRGPGRARIAPIRHRLPRTSAGRAAIYPALASTPAFRPASTPIRSALSTGFKPARARELRPSWRSAQEHDRLRLCLAPLPFEKSARLAFVEASGCAATVARERRVDPRHDRVDPVAGAAARRIRSARSCRGSSGIVNLVPNLDAAAWSSVTPKAFRIAAHICAWSSVSVCEMSRTCKSGPRPALLPAWRGRRRPVRSADR